MRSYSRYQQSPLTQSYNDIKPHQITKPRVSFANTDTKNPENDFLRLPALNSMRRSASISSTERNTKFKLQNLQQKLQELSADVHNTRLQAQQTLINIRSLKQSLAINQLGRIRQDIKKQIKGLERLVNGTKNADQERYRIVRDDCGQLWNQTENLRQNLFELSMRTQRLDLNMGFQKNL